MTVCDIKTMTLIAYEPLTDEPTGFCTGLYAAPTKTNQVFVAVPSLDGDETADIAGFEPATLKNTPVYLNAPDCVDVSVGDPWVDVMLLNGEAIIGSRAVILERTRDWFDDLLEDYPFTALDLVRSEPGERRRRAAAKAFERTRTKLNEEQAQKWAIETYFRGQTLTHIRRIFREENASDLIFEALRHLQVELITHNSNSISITLSGLSLKIRPAELRPLFFLRDDRELLIILRELPAPMAGLTIEVHVEWVSTPEHEHPKPVLVIPVGPDAERMVRSFPAADKPDRFRVNDTWPDRMVEIIDTYDPRTFRDPYFKDYSIVVALADESAINNYRDSSLRYLQEMMQHDGTPALIVAPVLPLERPSQHLEGRGHDQLLQNWSPHLLLDTSFVRSPAWKGEGWHSISRRVADYVSIACLLLLSSSKPANTLKSLAANTTTQCLGLRRMSRDIPTALFGNHLSEASTTKSQNEVAIHRARIDSAAAPSRRRSNASSGRYEIVLKDLDTVNFINLANAAVYKVLKRSNFDFQIEGPTEKFNEPLDGLQFPEFSAFLPWKPDFIRSPKGLLITAEAPSLEAILSAEKRDIQIVRYTDNTTLRRFLNSPRSGCWETELPADMALQNLPQPRPDYPRIFHNTNENYNGFKDHFEVHRWVFRRGRLPIAPRRLPEDVAAPLGWITFAGDIYAAAVVASDLFDIWVRAHIPASPGRGLRFVPNQTMDMFPWPDGFEFHASSGSVICKNPPMTFRNLARRLSVVNFSASSNDQSPTQLLKESDRGLHYELALSLLPMYNFPDLDKEGAVFARLHDLAHHAWRPFPFYRPDETKDGDQGE